MLEQTPAFSGYSVDSITQAQQFYQDTLGLTVINSPMGLELQFINGHRVFLYEKTDHQPASFTVLNFPVDSIETAVDELVLNGIVFERYDNLPASQDERGILRGRAANMGPDIAWFKDPAGNTLAVLQD